MTSKERLHKSLEVFQRSVECSMKILQNQCNNNEFYIMNHTIRIIQQRLLYLSSEITVAINQQLAVNKIIQGVA